MVVQPRSRLTEPAELQRRLKVQEDTIKDMSRVADTLRAQVNALEQEAIEASDALKDRLVFKVFVT